MKNLKLFAICFTLLCYAVSCTKEGPIGPAGTNGTNGSDGTDGNANIIVVNHPSGSVDGINSITVVLPAQVTPGLIDSSLVLVYYFGSSADNCEFWYPSPGLGCASQYQTRWLYNPASNAVNLLLRDPDGSAYSGSPKIFAKTKVIIAPGSSFFSGKREIDWSNYNEVKSYFNLAD